MLRQPPSATYCGLTVSLSQPSRFDKMNLLSANGGRLFNDLLRPHFNRLQCDIRLYNDPAQTIDGTKAILALGEDAAKFYTGEKFSSLGANRGSVYQWNGIPVIASFNPQDAADLRDYEGEFNELLNRGVDNESETDDDSDSDVDQKSRHGRTKRRNFRFWLEQDIKKIKYLLHNKGVTPPRPFEPVYIVAPPSEAVIKILTETKNSNLFLDIETDSAFNIKCFAFSFNNNCDQSSIWCVPCFNNRYEWSYSCLPLIFRSLCIAINNNKVIAHNGAGFDFLIFPWRYKMPIGPDLYDTMIANHRIYSDVEKSLGHCTSLWTWEPFHKDEGDVGYSSSSDVVNTLKYCGKDVYTMMLIYYAQRKYASKIPGLLQSIDDACAAIRPYIITMLQGMHYKSEYVDIVMHENDALMMQYIRICEILLGPKNVRMIAGKSKSSLLGSPKQCVRYFHDMLGYDVMQRSTTTKEPSLGKKAMYKLRLKYPENPLIELILTYRELAKESGSLKFKPWKE